MLSLLPVKAIPNPELDRVVERVSPECSPSPRSLSRRSSIESVRSVRVKSPPIVKKGSVEDLREAIRSEDHRPIGARPSVIPQSRNRYKRRSLKCTCW